MTDDGSNGDKGFVTDALKRQLDPENILGPGNVLTEVEG